MTDYTFTKHYKRFKDDAFKACHLTMDENDEVLNPRDFLDTFSLGILYHIIKFGSGSRQNKISIFDNMLSYLGLDVQVDGAFVFKYMEDIGGNETTGLASMMHLYTDVEDGKPMGWIVLTRACGTYNLQTGKENCAVQEAVFFMRDVDLYLNEQYPGLGYGCILSKYINKVLDIIDKDIADNVKIVE